MYKKHPKRITYKGATYELELPKKIKVGGVTYVLAADEQEFDLFCSAIKSVVDTAEELKGLMSKHNMFTKDEKALDPSRFDGAVQILDQAKIIVQNQEKKTCASVNQPSKLVARMREAADAPPPVPTKALEDVVDRMGDLSQTLMSAAADIKADLKSKFGIDDPKVDKFVYKAKEVFTDLFNFLKLNRQKVLQHMGAK